MTDFNEPELLEFLSDIYRSSLINPISCQGYEELIVEGVNSEQIWGQLTYRNDDMSSIFSQFDDASSLFSPLSPTEVSLPNEEEEIIFSDDGFSDEEEDSLDEADDDNLAFDDEELDFDNEELDFDEETLPMEDELSQEEEEAEEEEHFDEETLQDDYSEEEDNEDFLFEDIEDDGGDIRYEDLYGDEAPDTSLPSFDDEDSEEFDDDEEEDMDGEEIEGVDLEGQEEEVKLTKEEIKLRQLEEESLIKKDWFMKGEVSASQRPENSLLSAIVDFDTGISRKQSTAQEGLTVAQSTVGAPQTIDEMIKYRIKMKLFDDPIRTVKVEEKLKKGQKELDDSGPGQRQSLSSVYETEFLKVQGTLKDEKLEQLHLEAQVLFDHVLFELDKLTQTKHGFSVKSVDVSAADIRAVNVQSVTANDSVALTLLPHQLAVPESKPKVLIARDEMSKSERVSHRRSKKNKYKGKHVAVPKTAQKSDDRPTIKYGNSSEFFKALDNSK
ncbi:hypothetical protein RCL1_006103 [Eukaryota sp. TZLM3-RCL]